MARSPARTQSNAQESEAQRSEAQTSPDSTSMISTSGATDRSRLTTEEELAQIEDQAKLTPDDANAGKETIKVKTKGSYLVHDVTTNSTVDEKGSEVPLSAFIKTQLELGRIEKA